MNTTDVMFVCFEDDVNVVNNFIEASGIDLKKVSDEKLAGGQKSLAFDAYGFSGACIGIEGMRKLINAFNEAEFESPEFACLIIDDDNGVFSGIVYRKG